MYQDPANKQAASSDFAMAFSVFVEMINIRATRNVRPVDLHEPYVAESDSRK